MEVLIKMMKNKFKKTLQAAVLLSCVSLLPWQAEAKYNIDILGSDGTTSYLNLVVWERTDARYSEFGDVNCQFNPIATRVLPDHELVSIRDAFSYWYDISGAPKVIPNISIHMRRERNDNASAYSPTSYGNNTILANYWLQDKAWLEEHYSGDEIAALIRINDANYMRGKFYTDKLSILPENGIYSDYASTIAHELYHAMGLMANVYHQGMFFMVESYFLDNMNNFTSGLRDVYGNAPKAGMEFEKIAEDNINADGTLKNIANPNNGKSEAEHKFYMYSHDYSQTNGGAYFVGDNVLQVLNSNKNITVNNMGDNDLVKIAWPDNSPVPGVIGLPINGYEQSGMASIPELSHIELQNSLLSHQNYRNWSTFMEAELALMQDLGFKIDRSKLFGHSIYASNLNATEGEIGTLLNANATDEKSWNSSTDRAIGLHIYGKNNVVTLNNTANITASGDYSFGVRVDGRQNNLTIANDIVASGKESSGIAVTYGKEHSITIEKDASVSATDEGGIGARFDFGSNCLSDHVEYRGSYIYAKHGWDEFENYELKYEKHNYDLTPDLEGELVTNFNVNGKLSGKWAAIYISPNALVKNINIGDDAEIAGDIISEWNPEKIEYNYRGYDNVNANPYEGVTPQFTNGENGLTDLNFNAYNKEFTDDIFGPYSINLNINSGTLTTANKFNGSNLVEGTGVSVKSVTVSQNATYNLNNTLTVDGGYGDITVNGNFTLDDYGVIISAFNEEKNPDDSKYNKSLNIINNGTVNFKVGGLVLVPEMDYYDKTTQIKILDNVGANDNVVFGDGIMIWDVNKASTQKENGAYQVSPTLEMTAVQGENLDGTGDKSVVTIGITRTLEDITLNEAQSEIGKAYVKDAEKLVVANKDWEKVYAAIDFSAMDGSGVRNAFDQMLPNAYGYGAMATMDLHRMLSDFAVGGSLAPATNMKEEGQWHNIVIPYASETDHIKNGSGYKNNHTGMVGAMERTLGDVTVGWHAALNHQSTTGAEIGKLKGEGLYLGAQVKYAPESWKGWSTFGIARLGVEDLEMTRKFNFNGYTGKVSDDFTAFSGSLRVGGAYEKEAKAMTFGPFVALDYAFAHHPSIDESGEGAGRLSVDGGTYDSLRTQLGYRIHTAPKLLEDRTFWQANAAIAWNHELLDDAGRISATFRDFGGNSFGCDVDNYGRDSLSLMAGMTFKNPSKLDVTFNLGTDIYRHGGNTLYAKCALEWKF